MTARRVFFSSPSGGGAPPLWNEAWRTSGSSAGAARSAKGSSGKRAMPFANIDNNVVRGATSSGRGGVNGRFGVTAVGTGKRLRHTVSGAANDGSARLQQRQNQLRILTKTNTSASAEAPRAPSSNTPTPTVGSRHDYRNPVPTPEAEFVEVVNRGQRKGRRASLTSEGCGGAYYVHDVDGACVGVWKPRDEEPYAPANPRGYVDANIRCGSRSPMRPGFRVGWGFLRERAVYNLDKSSALKAGVPLTVSVSASPLLDQNNNYAAASSAALLSPVPTSSLAKSASTGFSFSSSSKGLSWSPSVPVPNSGTTSLSTTMATAGADSTASYPPMTFTVVSSTNSFFAGDLGSLQRYVPHAGTLDDYGTSGLSKLQCQIIATLDIRIMNADRHGANILVIDRHQGVSSSSCSSDSSERGIVPIDHGYALPPCFEERAAAANPFLGTSSLAGTTFIWQGFRQCREPILPQVRQFIQSLDLLHDARLLRGCGIESEAILTNRIGTALLQRGAAAGLTLSEIASICLQRQGSPSTLERHVQAARHAVRARKQTRRCVECTFGKHAQDNCCCSLCQTFHSIDFDALVEKKS